MSGPRAQPPHLKEKSRRRSAAPGPAPAAANLPGSPNPRVSAGSSAPTARVAAARLTFPQASTPAPDPPAGRRRQVPPPPRNLWSGLVPSQHAALLLSSWSLFPSQTLPTDWWLPLSAGSVTKARGPASPSTRPRGARSIIFLEKVKQHRDPDRSRHTGSEPSTHGLRFFKKFTGLSACCFDTRAARFEKLAPKVFA